MTADAEVRPLPEAGSGRRRVDTARVAELYRQLLTELGEDAGRDGLAVVAGIPVWSLCEHHLVPMRLTVTIGYCSRGQLIGLSKFARIAQAHAGRPQLQERFTHGVAQDAITAAGSGDVGVVAEGEPLWMSMRGVRDQQARTTTVRLAGRLLGEPGLACQLLTLAGSPR